MRILFISRAFPPVIGGIEKQNFEISKALSQKAEVKLIVNRHGKKFLLPFFIFTLYRVFRLRNQYDVILLGDGVLAILAFLIKIFSKGPIVCIVHGLDITYSNFIYRKCWLNLFFPKIDQYIAVGNETIRQAKLLGINTENFTFVPNGVDTQQTIRKHPRSELEGLIGYNPDGPVLLTLGRLVRRKGVLWFIQNVIPALDPSITYLIAGKGRDEEAIKQAVDNLENGSKVRLLGQISEIEKEILLSNADLFVQPNIKVENDIEGFGLVVLEAALYAMPVVASRIEGLEDAITDKVNGFLLESGNAEQYIEQIELLLGDPNQLKVVGRQACEFVKNRYSWSLIAQQYLEILKKVNAAI